MPTKRPHNWVITGATGFIGRELVLHLLKNTPDSLTLLSRPSPDGMCPVERILGMLHALEPTFQVDPARIRLLESDVCMPRLGLSDSDLRSMFKFRNSFVHLAANTQFTNSLEEAFGVNLNGARHALDVAEALHQKGCLVAFGHVSTAYVHGDCKDVVPVDQPLEPERLRNSYEKSKCVAELTVRECMPRLPITIFRPSIVVGNSLDGRASGGGTVYWALKRYRRGQHRFYANAEARLDLVPVDYVVQALAHLAVQPTSIGQCYPLVSGHKKDIALGHFVSLASEYLDQPLPKLIAPRRLQQMTRLLSKLPTGQRLFFKQMQAYLPYFSANPRFDASVTERALRSTGIECPAFDDYAEAIIRHCDPLATRVAAPNIIAP